VPGNERLDGRSKCAHIHRSYKAEDSGQIIGYVSGLEFIEEPQPLLCERDGVQLLNHTVSTFVDRSYWIPGAYAPTLSENHDSFLRLLKNKDFKEESMTKVELDAIGTSTPLESNKSLVQIGAFGTLYP
jgi:hypothetical protein